MRLATAVLAACALSIAASDSSADDAAPRAAGAKPLRLALEAGKTYLYRFRHTMTHRKTVDHGARRLKGSEGRTDLEWTVGLSLLRAEPNGLFTVSLLPERVRGSVQRPGEAAVALDSDINASLLSGWIARATLSPQGRVIDAAWFAPSEPGDGPLAAAPPVVSRSASSARPGVSTIAESRGTRNTTWHAVSFVRLFVHEFHSDAPRANGSWTVRSELPPEWRVVDGSLSSDALLADDATATFSSAGDEPVARFALRGKARVTRSSETIDLTAGFPQSGDRILEMGEQFSSWAETGELRVRRDSGLTALRTSEGSVSTYANAVRLPRELAVAVRASGSWSLPDAPTDHVYEFTTRVELVGVR